MNIAIVGYGKMGEQVEKTALERQHKIVACIDNEQDWEKYADNLNQADIAVEFSTPDTVLANIEKCFQRNLPVVVGTTGWHNHLQTVKNQCTANNQTLLYASNFSLGVNIFFALNRKLAKMMNPYQEYDVSMEEIHHTAKKDAPSGTAITLANDIIKQLSRKKSWTNEINDKKEELSIKSVRLDNITGMHTVTYSSDWDEIEIKHVARNRKSFAVGAVKAAEWLVDKRGFFSIDDMLNF
ncbi:MAG: 4-hydroxy-tetrahydrodipicolinate reductase [Lentimicrobiaceae bacterium]|nr:4-hydroxy-tetrahydrodipicolinate reductase [Lentimicrobiaceae bacterium]